MKKKKLLQIGAVVNNREEAVRWYQEMLGLGPFTLREMKLDACMYYGEPRPQHLKLAMCQFGPMILELIEVVGGSSVHRDYLEKHGPGIDHLALQVEDLQEALAQFQEKGLHVVEGDPARHFAYVDFERVGGVRLELIELPEGKSLL